MEYKFKVGDKVRIKDSCLPIDDNWLGEEGRLTHQGPYIINEIYDSDGYQIIRKLSDIKVCLVCDEDRFELVEDKLQLSIGDKVKVVKYIKEDSLGPDNFKIGDEFYINHLGKSMFKHIGTWVYDKDGKEISVNSLELVKESPQFKVGKWYKGFFYNNTYAKFKKIDGERWIGSEWISKEGVFYEKEEFYSTIYVDSYEISLEEIQQYLPDGHPDKLTPNPVEESFNNFKFNIGDTVQICSKAEDSTGYGVYYLARDAYVQIKGLANKIGNISDRIKTVKGVYYRLDCFTSDSIHIHEDRLTLKQKETIKFKFNIGDKVEITSGGWQYFNPKSEDAFGVVASDRNKGDQNVISDRVFNKHNNINWYKFSNYGNWITECGLKLVSDAEEYQCSPKPESAKYVKLTPYFDKWFDEKNQKIWSLIPKNWKSGVITWINVIEIGIDDNGNLTGSWAGNTYPEANRYCANIPIECFELVDKPENVNYSGQFNCGIAVNNTRNFTWDGPDYFKSPDLKTEHDQIADTIIKERNEISFEKPDLVKKKKNKKKYLTLLD